MIRNRKNYTAKFKAKVVRHALCEDVSISELSSIYGVHSSVITRWKKEALQSIEDGFSGNLVRQQVDTQAQINMLHTKIGKLTVERDFLADASDALGLGSENLLSQLYKNRK